MPQTQQGPKKGVCSFCQSLHTIHQRIHIPDKEMETWGPYPPGSVDLYELEEHMIDGGGSMCEGTKRTPQVILTEQWKPFIEKIMGQPVE